MENEIEEMDYDEKIDNLDTSDVAHVEGSADGEDIPKFLSSQEKRRERNKLLARKSRDKVKNELDTLRNQFISLMRENEELKKTLGSSLAPPIPAQVLLSSNFELPDGIKSLVKQLMFRGNYEITEQRMKNSSYSISNAIGKDMPLVYCSPGFLKLTGYEMHEIMGRNCRFLQGPETDRNEIFKMKRAIMDGKDISVVLKNYRKDGKAFWNQVRLAHLKDQSGRTFLIVGIQTAVTFKPLDAIADPVREPSYFAGSAGPPSPASYDGSVFGRFDNSFTTSQDSKRPEIKVSSANNHAVYRREQPYPIFSIQSIQAQSMVNSATPASFSAYSSCASLDGFGNLSMANPPGTGSIFTPNMNNSFPLEHPFLPGVKTLDAESNVNDHRKKT